jgi:hypothetical protein
MPRVTSPTASVKTLPCSLVIMAANSSRCSLSRAKKRCITRARVMGGVSDQAGKAACAAATVRFTSSLLASATWRVTCPVAGLVMGAMRLPVGVMTSP